MQVQELVVYPVKSLRGISVERWSVEWRGLRHDRRWMLVDEDGRFLTQREHHQMALIDTGFHDGCLVVAKGPDELAIPLEPHGPRRMVTVWNDTCEAQEVSEAANQWFTHVLGMPCALVMMPESTERLGRGIGVPPMDTDFLVGFADSNPILVAGQASMDDLNGRLASPLPIRRFRPNLVVSGSEPYAEDEWTQIQIGPVTLHRTKKAGRCLMTTIDIETGQTAPEPLRTLATYRKEGSHVWFGCYYRPETLGEIAVGDAVMAQ